MTNPNNDEAPVSAVAADPQASSATNAAPGLNGDKPKSRADMTPEELKAFKEKKKAEKEAKKAEKAAKKAASVAAGIKAQEEAALVSGIEYLSIEDEPKEMYGTYAVIQSKCAPEGSGRVFTALGSLANAELAGTTVWVRGRMQKMVANSNKFAFLTIRSDLSTVQAILNGKEFVSWAKKNLTAESIIDVQAELKTPDGGVVAKCTIGTVELHVKRIYLVSRAEPKLPLTLEDAARPLDEDQTEVCDETKDEAEERQKRPTVTRDTRLNNRIIDIRVLPHASLMRVQAGVSLLFREYLQSNGFIEIHSPKILAGASEGGSDVFNVKYFDNENCCLAQSPQLFKQMAICGDMKRVYEIGPVFRAEKSNTHRHLCEFTGLDLEMEINEHYSEILDVLDGVFSTIFEGLESRYSRELAAVREKWNVPKFEHLGSGKQLRLKWPQGIAMLRADGCEIGDFEDLNTEKERWLGRLVKAKYGTDFFMLTHFPSAIRPFYTMVDPIDGRYSNSYDLFMRGEEIVSGAQRVHDVELLKARATAILGEKAMETISSYVDAFKFGAPPHGGAGVGLERVVMLYLGVGNIRECTYLTRDPNRLNP